VTHSCVPLLPMPPLLFLIPSQVALLSEIVVGICWTCTRLKECHSGTRGGSNVWALGHSAALPLSLLSAARMGALPAAADLPPVPPHWCGVLVPVPTLDAARLKPTHALVFVRVPIPTLDAARLKPTHALVRCLSTSLRA
jgi:hypothetical protein